MVDIEPATGMIIELFSHISSEYIYRQMYWNLLGLIILNRSGMSPAGDGLIFMFLTFTSEKEAALKTASISSLFV